MNVLSYALPCRGGGLNIAFVRLVASPRIYLWGLLSLRPYPLQEARVPPLWTDSLAQSSRQLKGRRA